MIVWNFNAIVALAMTFGLGLVIVLWLFYTWNRGRLMAPSDRDFFRQCRICGYLYLDYFRKDLDNCPRCGSY